MQKDGALESGWEIYDQHRNTNMNEKDHLVGQLTTVMQKGGAMESGWDSKKSAIQLLQLFQGFANKVLKAIDEDPNLSRELKMEADKLSFWQP